MVLRAIEWCEGRFKVRADRGQEDELVSPLVRQAGELVRLECSSSKQLNGVDGG